MTRTSSEPLARAPAAAGRGAARARIVPAGALGRVEPVWLGSLPPPAAGVPPESAPASGPGPGPVASGLRARDLDTEVGRAAYQLGRRRGLAEGQALGLREGRARAEADIARDQDARLASGAGQLQALAEAFRAELSALETALAGEVAGLALAIARQVLRRELAQPETVLAVAREALQGLAAEAGTFELLLNPSQAEMLAPWLVGEGLQEGQQGSRSFAAEAAGDALAEAGAGAGVPGAGTGARARPRLTLRADPSIAPGGCRLLAATGEVDATVGTRWAAVLDRLGWPQELAP